MSAPGGCTCWNCRHERPELIAALRQARRSLLIVALLAAGHRPWRPWRLPVDNVSAIHHCADEALPIITRALVRDDRKEARS